MKKFFKTRLAVIVITALVCIIAFSGIAYASGTFNKDIPTTAHITATNPAIGIYSDENCTIPLTTIAFGNIDSGSSVSKVIYIKNIGNKDFGQIVITSNLDPAIGTITSTNIIGLTKDQSIIRGLTLNTLTSNIDLDPEITITLTGTY